MHSLRLHKKERYRLDTITFQSPFSREKKAECRIFTMRTSLFRCINGDTSSWGRVRFGNGSVRPLTCLRQDSLGRRRMETITYTGRTYRLRSHV